MNSITYRWLSRLAALAALAGLWLGPAALPVKAATPYSVADGSITISSSGDYIITGTTTTNIITVNGGLDVNITLSNVSIQFPPATSTSALIIGAGSTVNLTLAGANTLQCGHWGAGVLVPATATLVITADSTGGSLIARGGLEAPGIGGARDQAGGSVIIKGGTVTADAGSEGGCPGINASTTVDGGTVTATGSYTKEGISNASAPGGGTVIINGGTVTASPGHSGSGIGSGSSGTVIINGGTVTATGYSGSPGISGASISISGGRVAASGGNSGIGGTSISISGGTVTATAFGSNPGISGINISISGGSVNATMGATPSDLAPSLLYLTTVTLTGISAISDVTCSVDGGPSFSCATDAGGRLYLWLPLGGRSINIVAGASAYAAYGTVTSGVNAFTALSPPAITTDALPAGLLGKPYSFTLAASDGGLLLHSWSATGLPAGLSLGTDSRILSGTPAEAGRFTVNIQATAGSSDFTKALTLDIYRSAGGGAYSITPDGDAAYSAVLTADGIPTLTVNPGVTGLKYFTVAIEAAAGHDGLETAVFVHLRGGRQLGIMSLQADYDVAGQRVKAGFNVQPGDIIKVFIVDDLSNDPGVSPTIL